MKRRKFLTNSLLASVVTNTSATELAATPPKKSFKVTALEYRQKEKIIYGDVPVDFKLLSTDTENRFSVFISTNNRKGYGAPPLHVHYSFDEFFCVLTGEFVFLLDGERVSAKAGDTIFIPRGVKHTFTCLNDQPSALLVAITPGQGSEQYFVEMGKALTPQGPDMAVMAGVYKKYNSEILGPPME